MTVNIGLIYKRKKLRAIGDSNNESPMKLTSHNTALDYTTLISTT